jgi:hypothetical protein
MPAHDLRYLAGRRGVAASLRADDAVDDHADAGQIAELDALQNIVARRMLRAIYVRFKARTCNRCWLRSVVICLGCPQRALAL